ncbi:MAG: hypothetical protein D6772_11310, partial [Bacteroidetes bacterium]
ADFGAAESQYFSLDFSLVTAQEPQESAQQPWLSPNPLRRGQQLQLLPPAWAALPHQWLLYSATGQLLSQGETPALPHTTHLAPGYYLLSVRLNGKRQWLPFIVQ